MRPVKKTKLWWIIDPRVSKLTVYWDGVTMTALVFTAFITPFSLFERKSASRPSSEPDFNECESGTISPTK